MPNAAEIGTEPSIDLDAVSRRANPRYACKHVTFYRSVANRSRDAELATVHDISLVGIGLLVRQRIDVGTILAIELNSTLRTVRHQRLARVAHVTDHPDGHVLIGCEFASRLSEDELASLTR